MNHAENENIRTHRINRIGRGIDSGIAQMRGGKREGAGRPRVEDKRKMRALRATDAEWNLLQKFSRMVKKGNRGLCEDFIAKYYAD